METTHCILHALDQRSEGWHEIRSRFLTASKAGKWLTNGKSDQRSLDARASALARIVAARLGCEAEPPWKGDWETRRGQDLEPAARDAFARRTGFHVETAYGFAESRGGCFGCSPDGLIFESATPVAGLEIKCPRPDTHVARLLAGETELPDEYRLQVQFSLAVTGLSHWYHFTWNPNLPPIMLVCERDAEVERMVAALRDFSREVEQAAARLATLSDARPQVAPSLADLL